MRWFETLALHLFVAFLVVGAGRAVAEPETVTLTILHTNDLSGDMRGAAGRAALIRQALAGGLTYGVNWKWY